MNELRQKRKELGLTQAQAAAACQVSRRTFQTYEENRILNETYEELLAKLDAMGVWDNNNYVSNPTFIKKICREILSSYPEVDCAYLFGSYARGEATGKSDIDILLVCPPMGMKLYEIGPILEGRLHKRVDLHTHRQLLHDEALLSEVLKDGIKIYGK